MKHNKIFAPVVLALAFALGCGIWAYSRSKSKVVMTSQITSQTPVMEPGDALVDIKTSMGDIRVRLFGDTPRHRDNFLKLVKDGYYNDVLFHRVINEFMVQTGDPDSKNAPNASAPEIPAIHSKRKSYIPSISITAGHWQPPDKGTRSIPSGAPPAPSSTS